MLLVDLFLVGIGALVGGWICRRVGIPEVLGYLAAGILLGPHVHGYAIDSGVVKNIAQFAVVFRMFTLGLDFDARRLRGQWRPALSAGLLEMVACTVAGAFLAGFLGWSVLEGAILGAALGTTSTSILSKAIADRNMSTREDARAAGAATLVEDLVAMSMLALLAVFHGASGPAEVLQNALWLLVFAALSFTAGAILVPEGLDRLGKSHSDELLSLAVIGVLFGFAALSELLGAGRPVGAFLAGIMVGAARHAPGVQARVLPLRDVLAAVAYVSIGLLLDPFLILQVAPYAIAVAILFVPLKALAIAIGLRAGGVPTVTAARAGAILGQTGTMGIVVACRPFLSDAAAGRLMAFAFVSWAFTVGLTGVRLRWLPDVAERVALLLGAKARAPSRKLRRTLDAATLHDAYVSVLAAGCAIAFAAVAAFLVHGAVAMLPRVAVLPAAALAGALMGLAMVPFAFLAAAAMRRALHRSGHHHMLAPARLAHAKPAKTRAWGAAGTAAGLAGTWAAAAGMAYALAPESARWPFLAAAPLAAGLVFVRPRILERLVERCETLLAPRPAPDARLNDFRGVSPFGFEVEAHPIKNGTRAAWTTVGRLDLARTTGARVVAVLRPGAHEPVTLTPETVLHPGEEIVIGGTPAQLVAARKHLLEAAATRGAAGAGEATLG